jgi:CheY-like chemotaxis protein
MADILEATNQAPKVLIADDDPGIVRFLTNRCAKLGFEVQTAANGLQALIMATQNRRDVLIIDINMPEVEGLSVCLRTLHPDKTPINVVVITASSNPETVERCESFGAFYARKGDRQAKRY